MNTVIRKPPLFRVSMQELFLVRNHPFMLFTGVLLGFLSSFLFIRQSATVMAPTSVVQSSVDTRTYLTEEISFHETLYVAVIASSSSLTNALSVSETWGQSANFIEYYVNDSILQFTNLSVVRLPSNDKPLFFELLFYLHQEYNDNFNWFLIANDEMYVRVQKLANFLNKLDPTADIYLGAPSQLPWYKQNYLFQNQELFCKGNTGIILSREMLRKLVPYIEHCLQQAQPDESFDILLGRCIRYSTGVYCNSNSIKEVKLILWLIFNVFLLDNSIFL